ncbi:hypothetical protein TNCV_3659431 [Trichonephila clavipes]|nr:hypothetical protein TNCV_3659431 [Trichonephila clavipes]
MTLPTSDASEAATLTTPLCHILQTNQKSLIHEGPSTSGHIQITKYVMEERFAAIGHGSRNFEPLLSDDGDISELALPFQPHYSNERTLELPCISPLLHSQRQEARTHDTPATSRL